MLGFVVLLCFVPIVPMLGFVVLLCFVPIVPIGFVISLAEFRLVYFCSSVFSGPPSLLRVVHDGV